jgi:Protein of unknown function (DUF3311)
MASGPGLHVRNGSRGGRRRAVLRWIAYALLLGESLVILIPSVYGRDTPKLFGIPFFYWFQLLWIIVGMVVTGIAYLLVGRADRLTEGPPHADVTSAR